MSTHVSLYDRAQISLVQQRFYWYNCKVDVGLLKSHFDIGNRLTVVKT